MPAPADLFGRVDFRMLRNTRGNHIEHTRLTVRSSQRGIGLLMTRISLLILHCCHAAIGTSRMMENLFAKEQCSADTTKSLIYWRSNSVAAFPKLRTRWSQRTNKCWNCCDGTKHDLGEDGRGRSSQRCLACEGRPIYRAVKSGDRSKIIRRPLRH